MTKWRVDHHRDCLFLINVQHAKFQQFPKSWRKREVHSSIGKKKYHETWSDADKNWYHPKHMPTTENLEPFWTLYIFSFFPSGLINELLLVNTSSLYALSHYHFLTVRNVFWYLSMRLFWSQDLCARVCVHRCLFVNCITCAWCMCI